MCTIGKKIINFFGGYKYILLIAAIFILFFILGLLTPYPLLHEDFDRYVTSQMGFWKHLKFWYNSMYSAWNSRLGDVLSWIFIPYVPHFIRALFVALVNCTFWIGLFYILKNRMPKKIDDWLLLGCAFLILFFSWRGYPYYRDFIWYSGIVTYAFPYMVMILFLIPYRLYILNSSLENPSVKKKILLFSFIILSGFFCGGSSEYVSPALILFLLISGIISWIKKKNRPPSWYFAGFFAAIAGFFILLNGGGSFQRAGKTGGLSISTFLFKFSFFEKINHLQKVYSNTSSLFSGFIIFYYLLLFIFFCYLCFQIITNKKIKKYISQFMSFKSGHKIVILLLFILLNVILGTVLFWFFPHIIPINSPILHVLINSFAAVIITIVLFLFTLDRINKTDAAHLSPFLISFIFIVTGLIMNTILFPVASHLRDPGAYEGILIVFLIASCILLYPLIRLIHKKIKLIISLCMLIPFLTGIGLMYKDQLLLREYLTAEYNYIKSKVQQKKENIVIPLQYLLKREKLTYQYRRDVVTIDTADTIYNIRRTNYYNYLLTKDMDFKIKTIRAARNKKNKE